MTQIGSAPAVGSGPLGSTSQPANLTPTAAQGLSADPRLLDPSLPPASETGESGGFEGLLRTIKRRQGLFLFTFALVSGALAANTLRERLFSPVFEGGFQIQTSNPLESRGGISNSVGSVEAIARSSYNVNAPGLIVLLRSPMLLRSVAEKEGIGVGNLANKLTIVPANPDVQNVLNVSLRWSDPVKGLQILNQIAQAYTRFSITQRQTALDSGIQFLDRQAPEILQRVERIQGEMLRFRQRNNNIDPGESARTILTTREELVQQLRLLQNQQVQLNSKLASIQSGRLQWFPSGAPTAVEQMGRQGAVTPGRGPSGEAVSGSKTPLQQLNEIETDLASARATYREDSPIVQSVLARRNALMPVVRRQSADLVRADLLANAAQQDEINRQILLLNQNFRSNPQKLREFEDLQGRLALAREHYSSYIQARENFRLELARSNNSWQVITPPQFADLPVEPDLQRNLIQALFIGLLAGVAAAALRERTDNVFHTPMDAEKELQLPVLGLIPFLPLDPGAEISSSIARMSAGEKFAVKESLRSLFTSFRLLRADRNIRMVSITSSTQAEGKSTAVTVFARTLADLGLKVLIVDADMRLPMQTRYLGIEQGDGLSSLLSDASLNVVDLIQSLSDHFDVLPSGPKPPDPAKLLNSRRCQEVVDEIRDLPGYDIVLWDTPPCLMLSDPILLGEKLDGILFLVGLGKVSRDVAPQACRRIRSTGVDVLGLICNQINYPTRLNDYGYQYGYYYHYAYATADSSSPWETSSRGRPPAAALPIASAAGSDSTASAPLATAVIEPSLPQVSADGQQGSPFAAATELSPGKMRRRRHRRSPLRRAVDWLQRRLPSGSRGGGRP